MMLTPTCAAWHSSPSIGKCPLGGIGRPSQSLKTTRGRPSAITKNDSSECGHSVSVIGDRWASPTDTHPNRIRTDPSVITPSEQALLQQLHTASTSFDSTAGPLCLRPTSTALPT